MNKEEKRHVGRPTNEEVKHRKNKRITKMAAIVVLAAAILLIGVNLLTKEKNYNKLMGDTNAVLKGKIKSNTVKTYSLIKSGNEPNTCRVKVLSLSGNTLKYQIICEANARPMSIRIINNKKETKILDNFNMHKGYFAIHTYNLSEKLSEDAILRINYKKQYRNDKKDDKTYKKSVNIYTTNPTDGNKKTKLNVMPETLATNTRKIPDDKCELTISNISKSAFTWEAKCDKNAKPQSIRLETVKNGKKGSQVAVLENGFNNAYGYYNKAKVSKQINPNTEYVVVLYFGTKEYDYYRTEVSFKTLSKDAATAEGYIHTTKKATTKSTPKLKR